MGKQEIYDVLRRGGLSHIGAIGMLANIGKESNFRSNNVEDGKGWSDHEYTHAVNTGEINKDRFANDGIGYGLCQWTLAYRKELFWDFAYMSNESVDDEFMQCQFILYELKKDYATLFSFLCTTEYTIYATVQRVLDEYERPTVRNFDERYALAMQLEEEIKQNGGERMTRDEAIHKLCALTYEQVGYHEGANNYNKYAENPLVTKALGWNAQNQPWCAIFVVAMMIDAFGYYAGTNMMYGCSAGCAVQADYYRHNAAFYSQPNKGDQIFFFVNGGINHTGIVTDVSGSTITTVEGNTSDGVNQRTYFVGDGNIAGYGRPNWAIVANDKSDDEDPDPKPVDEPRAYPVIRYGDGNISPMDTVKAWQMLLICWGYNIGKWGADGDFGVLTMQRTKELQKRCGIEEDGIVGEETWKQAILMPKGV